MEQREKFHELYEYIKANHHLSASDFAVGKKKYNSSILLGLTSSILNGKTLFVGEYGLGKTTLAETLCSLTLSIPRSKVASSSIKGHPELNYEQMIGRPDLGKLNNGEEEVIWSDFVKSKGKLVDELNRIPEGKQNILLTGMQSNTWSYLNQSITSEDGPWFATKNYKDSGNYRVIPPLMDRFDLAIETKSPGVNVSRLLRDREEPDIDLYDLEESREGSLEEEFRKHMKDQYGLELLTDKDKEIIRKQVKNQKISTEGNYFLDTLTAELSSCQVYGQKRSNDTCPTGCHFSQYACNKVNNTLSVRSTKSIAGYAKALSWIDGADEVTVRHIAKIAPYATWHKTGFEREYISNHVEDNREQPLDIYLMEKTVDNIQNRFTKIKKEQEKIVDYIVNDEISEARKLADKLDHPVFKEYVK